MKCTIETELLASLSYHLLLRRSVICYNEGTPFIMSIGKEEEAEFGFSVDVIRKVL